jgi:hypothetical protein
VKIKFYNVSIFFLWGNVWTRLSNPRYLKQRRLGAHYPRWHPKKPRQRAMGAGAVATGEMSVVLLWPSQREALGVSLGHQSRRRQRQSLNQKKRSRWPRFRGLYNLGNFEKICWMTSLFSSVCQNTPSCFCQVALQLCDICGRAHHLSKKRKNCTFGWDDHAITNFEESVKLFLMVYLVAIFS